MVGEGGMREEKGRRVEASGDFLYDAIELG
jgi:hypothetical protein